MNPEWCDKSGAASPADLERSRRIIRLANITELAQKMMIAECTKQYPRSYYSVISEAESFVSALEEKREEIEAQHRVATEDGK